MARYQIANSFFIAMTSMQLDQPTSSSSTFWYPTLVGSYKVSHKMLRNPNRPCTNLRWTNHPHSTSVNLAIPKLMKLIMDKVWLRCVTIWTILAQVTLFTTSVANVAFGTSWLGIHLLVVNGVYLYQTSYGFASGQIPCCSQGTLLPSSGEPKVSNSWNNVQRKDSM
jgi:hypothetical protein